MFTLTASLVIALSGVGVACAAAASHFRLAIELIPAVMVMAFALLSLPAWWAASWPAWLILVSAVGGFVGLLASVWAWRTRTAQLRPRWWRGFERELDFEQMLHCTPED